MVIEVNVIINQLSCLGECLKATPHLCPKPFTKVNFSVSLFGDDLSYQWQYLNNGTNRWENLTTSTGAKTSTLTESASSFKNGMRYRCVVTNKIGQTAVSCEAVLTVK